VVGFFFVRDAKFTLLAQRRRGETVLHNGGARCIRRFLADFLLDDQRGLEVFAFLVPPETKLCLSASGSMCPTCTDLNLWFPPPPWHSGVRSPLAECCPWFFCRICFPPLSSDFSSRLRDGPPPPFAWQDSSAFKLSSKCKNNPSRLEGVVGRVLRVPQNGQVTLRNPQWAGRLFTRLNLNFLSRNDPPPLDTVPRAKSTFTLVPLKMCPFSSSRALGSSHPRPSLFPRYSVFGAGAPFQVARKEPPGVTGVSLLSTPYPFRGDMYFI